MEAHLADWIRGTPQGKEAEAILRSCVHCGFCTATCPTYLHFGDELDGPRGRIYLMKQVLEGAGVTRITQQHLDRCLTCRSCETTCPSGVKYGRLLDIGRHVVEQRLPRRGLERFKRVLLREVLSRRHWFRFALGVGRTCRPLLPRSLKDKLPRTARAGLRPVTRHSRRMLLLEGCVQPALAPDINLAAARILDRLGIELIDDRRAGCCGALRFHLSDTDKALDDMRRNIDAWWPWIEQGIEAIVITASGCGVTVKDYGHLLAEDPRYAEKAARVSALAKDICEIIAERSNELKRKVAMTWPADLPQAIAFHPPCTLQHGQQLAGVTEEILRDAGFALAPIGDAHLCCGSSGTYSLLQPEVANQLRRNKLRNLEASSPQVITTANIGCLTHLQAGTATPVMHWIELLDRRMN